MVVRNGTFNYSNIIEKVSYHLLLHLVVVFKSEMLNLNLNIDSKPKKKKQTKHCIYSQFGWVDHAFATLAAIPDHIVSFSQYMIYSSKEKRKKKGITHRFSIRPNNNAFTS